MGRAAGVNAVSAAAVKIWHASASTDQPGALESCCESWLDSDEIERANRFRRSTSRNQHVIGRGMAKRLLSETCQVQTTIRFAQHVHGKPYVAEPKTAAKQPFNIAHTEGLVLCGVGSTDHELLGVDIENIDRRTDPAIADRYFSEPEVEYLHTKQDAEERLNCFLRIWTLKESFIKAIGTGLQTPLADFAFTEIETDCPKIQMLNPNLESPLQWQFFSIHPKPGFIGAVAVGCRAHQSVEVQLERFEDLVF